VNKVQVFKVTHRCNSDLRSSGILCPLGYQRNMPEVRSEQESLRITTLENASESRSFYVQCENKTLSGPLQQTRYTLTNVTRLLDRLLLNSAFINSPTIALLHTKFRKFYCLHINSYVSLPPSPPSPPPPHS
jgi:hypothetical protein